MLVFEREGEDIPDRDWWITKLLPVSFPVFRQFLLASCGSSVGVTSLEIDVTG